MAQGLRERLTATWFPAISGSWAMWLLEGSAVAAAVSVALLLLAPGPILTTTRFIVIFLAVASLYAGPLMLIPALLATSGLHGHFRFSSSTVAAGVALILVVPSIQALPDVLPTTIPLASFGPFIACAAVSAIAALGVSGWRSCASVLAASFAMLAILDAAAARIWIEPSQLTDPNFRLFLVLVPCAAAAIFVSVPEGRDHNIRSIVVFIAVAAFGFLLGIAIFVKRPIDVVVFDESHGRWETILSPYGPDDFGRAANYTYSLLYDYAKRYVGEAYGYLDETHKLPSKDSAFVLKMPTKALSNGFSDRLEAWVRDGGRLLVVADHTDLYDTAQHLNSFLDRFGARIGIDALYDATGMPNSPDTPRLHSLLGRIDALGRPHPWQTGASLAVLPFGSVALASFGPSFAEPGDYSRQNRFGSFRPRVNLPFTSHVAVAAFPAGRGAVAVLADSTPWSNFAMFKEENPRLFRGILGALERPNAIRALGLIGFALALMALTIAAVHVPLSVGASALLLGLVFGSGSLLSSAAVTPPVEGRDFGLRVIIGPNAKVEFLSQLVGPGHRNYSRIISSTAKYGYVPLAPPPTSDRIDPDLATRWLVIEPDPESLPNPEKVFEHLRSGGDLTVLFAPDDAADPRVRRWVVGLGLTLVRTSGLALVEDAGQSGKGSFLSRRGLAVMRDVRVITSATPNALLNQISYDRIFQSYTIRPTSFPRTSGLLNIGFVADQFSDEAIGDVWEGNEPSSLGRLREAQMAATLAGEPLPGPWPNTVISPSVDAGSGHQLNSFVILEDGTAILQGTVKVDQKSEYPPSISDDPIGWASDLHGRAIAFLDATCPGGDGLKKCDRRLIGSDGIEWMVSRVDRDGALVALELLHERRFSGLGATINVVYADAP